MRARGTLLLVLAGGLACGPPLDRRDGAVLVGLEGAPERVDRVRVALRSGTRRFEIDRARPADDVIRDFTAVPVGPAQLTVQLFEGEGLVAERSGLPLEVAEGGTVEVRPFTGGPALRVEVRGGARHARWAGPIFVDVEDRTSAPPSEVGLAVQVAGAMEGPPVRGAQGWILEVDPARAGDLLPAPLDLRVEACFQDVSGTCFVDSVRLEVHRQAWAAELAGRPSGPATVLEDFGWVLVPDEGGRLAVFDLETGAAVQPALALGEELVGAVARAGSVLAVADRAGRVHGLELRARGVTPKWQAGLSAPRPSPVVSEGQRFVVADQAQILEIEPQTGATRELGRAGAPVVAAPHADEAGVVVADLVGGVHAFTFGAEARFTLDLGDPIYAPVVSAGPAGYLVATTAGHIVPLTPLGVRAGPGWSLGAPVVFAPVRVGDGWAVATARSLRWLFPDRTEEVPLGERVIGAPAPWAAEDGVVLGLFNGRVVVVRPGQGARNLARLSGLALAPVAVDAPPRALLGTSRGDFEVLRAEQDF